MPKLLYNLELTHEELMNLSAVVVHAQHHLSAPAPIDAIWVKLKELLES